MTQRAIIIGATSGIGRELAIQLAAQGYKVAATGRRRDLLETLASESICVSEFDASGITQLPLHLDTLAGRLGGLDLLVISAGTGDINPGLDFETEKRCIDLNVTAFTAIADWAIAYFTKQGSGHLAAITSVAALRGNRHAPAYNASKTYQLNYLEGLRQKVYRTAKQVYISDIRPGFVDTAMAKGEGMFWVASASKAATQIRKAIERKKSVLYVTRRWNLVAFILKILARSLYRKL